MKRIQNFTAIIEKEDEMYVAHCPELDVASQGHSIEEAKNNLQEAIELFLGHASESEVALRLKKDFFYHKYANSCWVSLTFFQVRRFCKILTENGFIQVR